MSGAPLGRAVARSNNLEPNWKVTVDIHERWCVSAIQEDKIGEIYADRRSVPNASEHFPRGFVS